MKEYTPTTTIAAVTSATNGIAMRPAPRLQHPPPLSFSSVRPVNDGDPSKGTHGRFWNFGALDGRN